MNFQIFLLLDKTGSHLNSPCSSPDSNLESGMERYVYRKLIAGIFESWAPILDT
jgi:hypothetical protein